jgi:hypothetical protein
VATQRHGSVVDLDACGVADAPLPTEETLLDASDALSARYLVYGATEQASPDLTPTDVRCLTDLEVTDPEIRDLLFSADITPAEQRRIDRRTGALADRCGLVTTG